ncbi:tetratricopeptide repeat protein [Pseudoalteromonas neustonica]|uniref:Tetratricopeptide repeat protein n=1 Tax=Pseudoalteromonas neustonica TaxID=1840331 RepID=A0ABU9U1N2_9GAMM
MIIIRCLIFIIFFTFCLIDSAEGKVDEQPKQDIKLYEELKVAILENNISKKKWALLKLVELKNINVKEYNYLYGVMALYGVFIDKNIELAISNLDCAASAGHIDASYLLGSYYAQSELPSREADEVKLLTYAAKNGHLGAMYNLYAVYENGGEISKEQAIHWLSLAAKAGAENSALMYAQILFSDAKEQENPRLALKSLDILQKTNFNKFKGEAFFLMAQIYGDDNLELVFDLRKSHFYIEKSASEGFPRAVFILNSYRDILNNESK